MVGKPIDKSESRQKAIIVLGMHRSGTSAVSGVLHILGVDLGPKLMQAAPDNPKGFWEHDEIVAVHERLLGALNLSWNDLDPFPHNWWKNKAVRPFRDELQAIIQRDFAESMLWGLKDPRMCRLMPLWLEIFKEVNWDPYFVHVVRNPIEVAESLRKRDGFSRRKSILLWMLHELEAEQWTRDYPRVFISFKQLLSNWPGTLEKISEGLGIKFPVKISDVVDKVSDFLDLELKHHNRAEDLWSYDPDTPQCVLKAYSDFENASEGQDANFVASLSECRAEFEASMQAYPSAAMMEELRQQREKWQSEKAGLAERIQSLSAEVSARDGRIAELQAAVQAKEAEKQGLAQRVNELDGLIQQKDGQLGDRATRIEELSCALNDKEQRLSELEQALAARDTSIAELQAAVQAKEAEKQGLAQRVNELDGLIQQKDGQLGERATRIEELSCALNDKEQRLSELEQALAARDTSIAELQAAVQAKEAEKQELAQRVNELDGLIQQKDGQLGDRATRIEELSCALNDKEQRLSALEQALAARDTSLAELQAAVQAKEAEKQGLAQRVNELDGLIQQKVSEVTLLRSELNECNTHLIESTNALIAEHTQELERMTAQIAEKEAQLRALDYELASVYRSRSWRLSSPVRAIGSLLKSLRPSHKRDDE